MKSLNCWRPLSLHRALMVAVFMIFASHEVAAAVPCGPANRMFSILNVEDGTGTLQIYEPTEEREISLNNLSIDAEVVAQLDCRIYVNEFDLKLFLIENEAADIIDVESADPTLFEAYQETRRYRQRFTADGGAHPPGVLLSPRLSQIWNWVIENWFWLFGGAGLPLTLYYLFRWAKSIIAQRHLKVILLGRPSVGKSALVLALGDRADPNKVFDLEPSVALSNNKIQNISDRLNHYQFFPSVVDPKGRDPAAILPYLQPESIPFTTHRNPKVLIIVIAPHPEEKVLRGDPYDRSFISLQGEFIQTCLNFIGATSGLQKLACVGIFVTKSDLIVEGRPTANDERAVFTKVDEIASPVIAWAKRKNIPVAHGFGSAVSGVGVRDFKDRIISELTSND